MIRAATMNSRFFEMPGSEAKKPSSAILTWHGQRFVEHPTRVKTACVECGRSMWLPRCKLSWYTRCGPECVAVHRAREKERLKRFCHTCGKTFYPRTTQLSAGQGRFCSQKCNQRSVAQLQTPEALATRIKTMQEAFATGRISPPHGPAHPNWKGGKEFLYKTRIENGESAKWTREYRAKNPDKVRSFTERRKGRKLGRLPYGTIPKIGAAQKWKCAACRISVKKKYHVDHLIPLFRDGKHEPSNLQILCPTCNLRKSAKDPIAFMQSLGRLL